VRWSIRSMRRWALAACAAVTMPTCESASV
jgi:hypothetical protein